MRCFPPALTRSSAASFAGAIVAATVTYVIPIFSTLAGVLLLGERLTAGDIVGAPLIVASAALVQQQRIRDRASPGG